MSDYTDGFQEPVLCKSCGAHGFDLCGRCFRELPKCLHCDNGLVWNPTVDGNVSPCSYCDANGVVIPSSTGEAS